MYFVVDNGTHTVTVLLHHHDSDHCCHGYHSYLMIYTYVRLLFVIPGVALTIGILGLGLFESTAIQFGMDQMLEAPSKELASFIQWYYWSGNIGPLVILCVATRVLEYFSQCTIKLAHSERLSSRIVQ